MTLAVDTTPFVHEAPTAVQMPQSPRGRTLLLLAPAAFCLAVLPLLAPPAAAQRVLFDARHGQTAGNADWVVDADSSEQEWLSFRCNSPKLHHSAQRFPTPAQSTIDLQDDEDVWDGGISAWAVDLVKDALRPERDRDWTIEQYPWNAPEMTFGDPSNPQDLAGYDVLVLCEPNVLFTDAEAQAIREFVANGGGLFLCADHETSDRNCSGGASEVHDSPFILNRLMQTDVETRSTPPYFDPESPLNDFGVFGIWFYENGNDHEGDRNNEDFDWFTEGTNRNVAPDPDDPILHGPSGDGSGGVANDVIFLNATEWLANPGQDETAMRRRSRDHRNVRRGRLPKRARGALLRRGNGSALGGDSS